MSVGNLAMWFYCLHARSEMSLLFKEQRQKEVENRFLGLSYMQNIPRKWLFIVSLYNYVTHTWLKFIYKCPLKICIGKIFSFFFFKFILVWVALFYVQISIDCPICWGYRIHWLYLSWRLSPSHPTISVLGMILNNLQFWSFGNVEYLFITITHRSTLT